MRTRRVMVGVLVAAALGAGVAGCGGDEESTAPGEPAPATTTAPAPATTAAPSAGDAAAGKAVFTANCAGCHTLADAGATGAAGPNLDQAAPAEDAVVAQVTNGGASMPAFGDRLSEQEIADVAAYVAGAAGG